MKNLRKCIYFLFAKNEYDNLEILERCLKKNPTTLSVNESSFVCHPRVSSSVARWLVFKPKIPIWVNFGGP
jgi:hypothetical protein